MDTILDKSISYILEDNLVGFRELVLNYRQLPAQHPRGTQLSICGGPVGCLYFLLDGIVKIYTSNINGYTRIVGYHKRNTIFAMDHLEQGSLAVVTAESVTPVSVIPLWEEDLLHLNGEDPTFLPALLRYYGHVLRLMCFDAENQSITDTATRLANFLCIYRRSREYQEKGCVAMTQDELASAVNASRVQVSRICADLRRQGIIEIGFKRLFVLDWEKVYAMVNSRGVALNRQAAILGSGSN